jgi:proteasome lid subunit RPN8/RPN11
MRSGNLGRVLTIDQAIHDEIVAHARRDHPDEACGVVAGPAGSDRAQRFIPMLNAARSPTFYEFDSADLLRLHKEMDERDEEPVVIYHSHTATEAYPSRTDATLAAEPGAHYVLVSTRDPEQAEFRSFRIVDGVVTEEPVELVRPAGGSWPEADRRHVLGHTPTAVVYDCPVD